MKDITLAFEIILKATITGIIIMFVIDAIGLLEEFSKIGLWIMIIIVWFMVDWYLSQK